MDNHFALLSLAAAIAVGAMSPGPSFLLVARTAVAHSRTHGLATAFGMGLGATVFAMAALLGLQALLAAVPWLYLAIKLAGGSYLVYLGWRIWRGARTPLAAEGAGGEGPGTVRRALLLGFITQISNPKTAVVYASLFAALLPREVSPGLAVALPLLVFVIETGWYAVVASVLSVATARATYLRYKTAVDRTAGSVMALLGLKLIADARST